MKQIKVKTLTAESFKEFGSFTRFYEPEATAWEIFIRTD